MSCRFTDLQCKNK